jgi:hypothetical protein
VAVDVRYDGKGTLVVAAQPGATSAAGLAAQSGCAFDLDGTGLCNGGPAAGRRVRARISPCQGTPGRDNPLTTYPGADVLAVVVNGSMYSDLNATGCDQEMNMVALVGDRASTGAGVTIQHKLQWYGVLMTRRMVLGQVPDFWQMPDLFRLLPAPISRYIRNAAFPVIVRNWRELF